MQSSEQPLARGKLRINTKPRVWMPGGTGNFRHKRSDQPRAVRLRGSRPQRHPASQTVSPRARTRGPN